MKKINIKYLVLLVIGAIMASNIILLGKFFYINENTGDWLRGTGVGMIIAVLFFLVIKKDTTTAK